MDSQIEVLRSACEESREVLDHELDVQADIDDKSTWSVRTAVIVLGLLLSAGSLGQIGQFLVLPWYIHLCVGFGVMSLILAVFLGIGSYTMTETHPGIDHKERIRELKSPEPEEDWRHDLLLDYQSWIANQKAWNEQNGYYLFLTHVALLFGITAIVIAGILALVLSYSLGRAVALGVGLVLPIVAVVLLLRER